MIDIDSIPFHFQVLRHCRCADCKCFHKDCWGQWQCRAGINATVSCWGTGNRELLTPADAWHYCGGYSGPRISPEVWLFPLDGPPLSDMGKLGKGAQGVRVQVDVERF